MIRPTILPATGKMSSDTKYHPHVTTDQITAALQTRSHPFDQDANYTSASLTNLGKQ